MQGVCGGDSISLLGPNLATCVGWSGSSLALIWTCRRAGLALILLWGNGLGRAGTGHVVLPPLALPNLPIYEDPQGLNTMAPWACGGALISISESFQEQIRCTFIWDGLGRNHPGLNDQDWERSQNRRVGKQSGRPLCPADIPGGPPFQ